MKKILEKCVLYILYKQERKLPSVQISLLKP